MTTIAERKQAAHDFDVLIAQESNGTKRIERHYKNAPRKLSEMTEEEENPMFEKIRKYKEREEREETEPGVYTLGGCCAIPIVLGLIAFLIWYFAPLFVGNGG